MKTRRSFIGGLLALVGLGGISQGKEQSRVNKDYEAGMRAAIRAGKGPAPSLDWKCYVTSLRHPRRHFQTGMIQTINYKDKTIDITIIDEYPINDPRSTYKAETNRKNNSFWGRSYIKF